MVVSRRKIIKSISIALGATATGFFSGTSFLFASDSSSAPAINVFRKRQLKAILIGTGKRGMHFAKHSLNHNELLEVVAVAEPIKERRDRASGLLGLHTGNCFNEGQELLSLPAMGNVAIIAAANNCYVLCKEALIAGYDVWVDRPVSFDQREILSINAMAKSLDRQLLFCYIHEGDFRFMSHNLFESNPAKV